MQTGLEWIMFASASNCCLWKSLWRRLWLRVKATPLLELLRL